MYRVGILFILFSSFLWSPFSNVHAQAQDTASGTRTVLIAFDGAQPEVIERLIRIGKLPRNGGFARLIREGTKAEGIHLSFPASQQPTISPLPPAPTPS